MRFLLFVLIVGAIALYFTNPTTDEVRAKLGGQIPAAMAGAPASAPGDQPAMAPAPADQPAMAAGAPPVAAPAIPGMPAGAAPAVADAVQGEMQLDRKDYYLFSVYKVTVGGQQLPGCVIGIAKQAIPSDKCPS